MLLLLACGIETTAVFGAAAPFNFRIPDNVDLLSDDDFANSNLVFLSKKEKLITPTGKATDPPVLCETICRPTNPEDRKKAGQAAAYASQEGDVDQSAFLETGSSASISALDRLIEQKMCKFRGGMWNNATQQCDAFMRATTTETSYDPKVIFARCQEEFSANYVPCNAYQALALANMYEVPDHEFYWLWPGGRFDQVSSAALRRDIGNNPDSGLDKCPDNQHIAFFHNWDAMHVDSWGCLSDQESHPVLCCRRA